MRPTVLTHLFTFFQSLGGVESMLQRHWRNDSSRHLQSRIFAFFEPPAGAPERVTRLGLTWRDSIISSRRKFLRRISEHETGVAVYHNAWGLPFLADLDRSLRRVSMLHSDLPTLSQLLESQRGLVDGVLCVTKPLRARALEANPKLSPDRLAVVPYPIADWPDVPDRPALLHRPFICGFAGRVVREQKRVDRLPQFCRLLEQAKVPYRFEILGDGPDRVWLEREFEGNRNVIFHLRRQGDQYWRILSSWDAIVFVSDYEGLPIAMLEAMSVGVLPIFPRIGSGGDAYAADVRSDFLYENLIQVPKLLLELKNRTAQEINAWRHRCRELAAPHKGDAYERAFAEFIHHIAAQPRVSASNFARPVHASDLCPFGLMRRFYYRGFFKGRTAP